MQSSYSLRKRKNRPVESGESPPKKRKALKRTATVEQLDPDYGPDKVSPLVKRKRSSLLADIGDVESLLSEENNRKLNKKLSQILEPSK